ncbi:activating transcription factor 7-interacting protein 1 [Drosophila obscura]|uniref:activating transcription factor 7-interacting protein 1 n=1 Tax=Drosophila obscura TaxID=7282 RepID=UPI001BB2863C|nr:activating transcription factor 7-interacting protein 1 [Drosophila obscura]XP_041448713.1 activating transcription factor 7-interacting protein 1 [Drosophila obscura]XP_041448714.1 activating transcription factor 7-interacting protein 1 [Drosophila obscura]
MMEISQNTELKELSTEGAIMGAIQEELNDDASPSEIGNGSRRSSRDDEDLKELTNGSEAIAIACLKSVKADDKLTVGLEEKRNAGNDLDALLDKISSIVDCPKDSPDSEEEAVQEPEATVVEMPTVDGDKEKEINPAVVKENTADTEEEEKKAAAGESSVTRDSVEKIQTEDSAEAIEDPVQDQKDTEELKDSAEAENDGESLEKVLDNKEESESVKEIEEEEASHVETSAEKTNGDSCDAESKAKLNQSTDDIFMDALDSISSLDDFGATCSQELKKTQTSEEKPAKAPKTKVISRESLANDLDDISSDEDILKEKTPDKDPSSIPVIDLDSSDECIVCEDRVANLAEDQKKVTDEITENKEEEKDTKETLGDTTSAEPMDVVEEDKKIADPEDTQQPEDESQTEERMETTSTVDDMAKEVAGETDKDAGEMAAKEAEDKTTEEDEKKPTTNGVTEREPEIPPKTLSDGRGMELELYKGKISPEAAAKDADSDDEVIFFEPIEKPKDSADPKEKKELKSAVSGSMENDIVLVSEDEEEELPPKKPEDKGTKGSEKESSSLTPNDSNMNPTESAASKDLQADNSDNACDQFEKIKPQDKIKPTATEDGNSNSSSNLLCPAEDVESDGPKASTAERANSDVESETKPDADADTEPKQSRISNDGNETESNSTVTKRSHDSLDSSPAEGKEGIPSKKLRTDDSDSSSSNDGTLQIDLEVQEKEVDSDLAKKEDPVSVKDQKELKLELKPEPERQIDVKPLRLEFLKSFRKSFDQMTRNDLEELVLQKVVESMMVKSEFADIRSQLDKYEKTLSIYRRRIAEVSKQFLDLDTVHKRVLKDLETKNAHFTAPVRITRAVGLQVGIPFKVMKPNAAPSAGDQTHAAGSMLAPPSSTPSKASTSPMRSPLQSMRAAGSGASSNAHQQQQQQNHQKQNQPQLPPQRSSVSYNQSPAPTATAPAPPVRRGCMQKITPQRPVPGIGFPAGQVNTQSNNCRLQSSPPGTQRPMHASKHTGSTASAAAMRNRSPYTTQKQQYQATRPVPGPSPAKQGPKCATKVRSLTPKGTGIVSVPVSSTSSSGGPGGSALNYGQQQPNLAPAKPKEKAVIDLTDEDDAAAAMAAAAAEVNAHLRQSSNMAVKRNSLGATTSESRATGGRTAASGNTVRLSPLQMPRANARQIVTNNGGGQRNSLGSNVTMQIRSENTPPAPTRLRYSHPAPLPSSPAQPFNPAWKLPPSRPLIRISLMDTGIVISWNLEDASSRFADCVTYQIFAYQETLHEPSTDSWRHVGDVKAMLLPMAVTLNQFQENQRYYFAVRGVDAHQRFGSFSVPKTWS